ncbi:MAG: restriction endonuclease subunit S, partial [Caldisericaceae bacterium]
MENKPDLPAGWKWVKLGEVCEINPPKNSAFDRSPETPTSFIPMESIDERDGKISKPFVVPYSKVAKGYTYFEENDILLAKITP